MSLRLGPLPSSQVVKITIGLPIALKDQLDRYAAIHSQQHGKSVDAAALVPHILAQFMARDRAFQRASKDST